MGLVGEMGDFFEEEIYMHMVASVQEFWAVAAFSGNEGQFAIAIDYIIPAGDDIIADWEGDWPDVDAGEYMECIDAHDAGPETWSETVEEVTVICEGFVEAAQILQDLIDAFEFEDAEDEGEGGGEE
jgi:hypothetical protein